MVRDSDSMEQIKMALTKTKVHMENLRNATFEDRVRIFNILDVKVYPPESIGALDRPPIMIPLVRLELSSIELAG
jgi:hypothetical protein